MSKKNRQRQQQAKASTPSQPPAKVVDAMTIFRAEDAAMRAAVTTDSFENFVSRVGVGAGNTLSAGVYTFNEITKQRIKLEAAYRGSWVVGVVVDAVAEDMTRAGIKIETVKGEKNLKTLQSKMSRQQVHQSMQDGIKWGRLYGGALGVIQIKGQKLDTPLDIETVAKDQFQGVVVYDRWQLAPDLTDVIESGPDMGLPKYYSIVNFQAGQDPDNSKAGQVRTSTTPGGVGSVRVHHSRCIRFIGIQLPYFQAITEMMWGESQLERLWDRLISFDNVTMSTASLVDRANLRTVGIEGLRQILALGGDAAKGLYAMFDMMNDLQTNQGLTLLDKEDTFSSTAYSFAGLSDVMLQFAQQLSGASGIPLVRFFGQSPSGLSATGEADMRMYYDNINAQQEARLRNPWELVLKVMWRSCFGEAMPEDLEFEFTPLWQMSATDKTNNGKTSTETILGAYEAGVTSKATTLRELRDNSGETGVFSTISDDDITEAEDEPPPDMPPGEGEPDKGAPAGGPPVPTLSLVPKKAEAGDSAAPRGVIARWLSKFDR